MARRKAKRGVTRKARSRRARRPAKRKTPARRASGGASSALASARARIDELEAENRRLRRELAAARGEQLGAEGNDAPLAPGM